MILYFRFRKFSTDVYGSDIFDVGKTLRKKTVGNIMRSSYFMDRRSLTQSCRKASMNVTLILEECLGLVGIDFFFQFSLILYYLFLQVFILPNIRAKVISTFMALLAELDV